MLFTIFSVFYVLIAAAMIILILLQRGDGANAGASFGGGASGTVFGARGAASFLTRTTGVLAGLLFALSIGMGIYLSHNGTAMQNNNAKQTLGVMAGVASSAPATSVTVPTSAPAASAVVPVAPAASANAEVPAAPSASTPASSK